MSYWLFFFNELGKYIYGPFSLWPPTRQQRSVKALKEGFQRFMLA